jgi:hypothetical protein
MKKLDCRLKREYATTTIISAVLLSSLLFVGFTGNNQRATLAYGTMMEDKGIDDRMMEGDKMSDDSIMMDDKTKMRHTLKGQISNRYPMFSLILPVCQNGYNLAFGF